MIHGVLCAKSWAVTELELNLASGNLACNVERLGFNPPRVGRSGERDIYPWRIPWTEEPTN